MISFASRRLRRIAALLLLAGLGAGAAGCGSSENSQTRNGVVGETPITCVLGGRGPTGGIVVALATSTSGTSVESAPANWTTESQVNWKTISARVNEYRAGGFSDWKLPTIDQMDTLGNPILQYVGGNMIWSSTAISGSTYSWYWRGYRNVADQTTGPSAAGWVMRAVPVRDFVEANTPCMTVAAVTTTAAPATTTTTGVPATCANGGVCAKQQIGGGGGTIVSESVDAAGGATYLEVAPPNWTANDMSLQMVDNYSISVAQKVKTYTIGGKNDWHLPTINEFASWCASGLVAIDKTAIYWVQNEGGATLAGNASSCSSSYGQTNSNTMLRVRPVRVTGVSAQVRSSAVAYFAANPTTTLAMPTTTTTSTTTTTTTLAPTTTRAASKCATGGSCAVGDTGPGGGIVFYVSPTPINAAAGISDGGKYLEAAPNTWNGGTSDPALPWCDKTTTMIGNPTDSGTGAFNTKRLVAACSANSAANVVANLTFNKWDDWFLPSGWELSFVWQNRDKIGGFNSSVAYWSSSEVPGNVAKGAQRLIFNPVRWIEDTKTGNYLVRPIRAFSEGAVPPKAPVQTTTTTAAVVPLALPPLCVTKCQIGNRGLGDGIIISMTTDGPTTRYLTVARDGWNGTAIDPKMTLAEAQATVAAYKPNGTSGWTLPSYLDKWGFMGQMLHVCKWAHQETTTSSWCDSSKPLRKGWSNGNDTMSYWTSHPTSWQGSPGYGMVWKIGTDGTAANEFLTTKSYVRPVLEFSYTEPPAPTTTTTVPQICANGGVCKIGDVSPTGGLIVKFTGTSSSGIDYLEVAQKNWDTGITGVDNNNGGDPSTKLANAATFASKYRGGGKTDWRLPNLAEMRQAFTVTEAATYTSTIGSNGQRTCRVNTAPGIGGNGMWYLYGDYWLSSGTPEKFTAPSGAVYPALTTDDVIASDWQFNVRPMRTGKYNGPAMTYVNPRFTPAECENAAIATTTTAPDTRTCAQGGKCKVGDVGQRGGVVISVDNSKPRGQRNVEMAKYGWLRGLNDCEGTSLGFSCNGAPFESWKAGRTGDNYRFPTIAELQSIRYLSQANKDILGLIDGVYWSSESCGKYMMVNVPLTSPAERLQRDGKPLGDLTSAATNPNDMPSFNIIDAHCGVRVRTGDPAPDLYGYTRPVRNF